MRRTIIKNITGIGVGHYKDPNGDAIVFFHPDKPFLKYAEIESKGDIKLINKDNHIIHVSFRSNEKHLELTVNEQGQIKLETNRCLRIMSNGGYELIDIDSETIEFSGTWISRVDAEFFDKSYFDPDDESLSKSNYLSYSWGEMSQKFRFMTCELISRFHPLTHLDVGCAKGFLVKAMREQKVVSYGFDLSEYAIVNCDPEVRNYVWRMGANYLDHASLQKEGYWTVISRKIIEIPVFFDLVTCIDVLEHVPNECLNAALDGIARIGKNVFIQTPVWVDESCVDQRFFSTDKSHCCVHSFEWWKHKFGERNKELCYSGFASQADMIMIFS